MMATTTKIKFNMAVEEIRPDHPCHGSEVWRLVSWTDDLDGSGGYPLFEIYRAEFVMSDDDGDPENGPDPSLELGNWEQVGGGVGFPALQQEIEQYHAAENDGPHGRIE